MPLVVARAFRDTTFGFSPSFHLRAMIVCVFLTVLWLLLVRPARRSNRRVILNWAAGATLIWAMYSTIWLPYLDSRRSYRGVVETAAQYLPRDGCVTSRNLGEPQRALFYYFVGVVTEREEVSPNSACSTLLVQYPGNAQQPTPAGWLPVWQGTRRGDATELYVIYRRAT
jgi:4-amino-4-deoxy-L-arabinose transferase-like glycosyltransferase